MVTSEQVFCKSQGPNPKPQVNPNPGKIRKSQRKAARGFLFFSRLVIWNLGFAWDLELGIWDFSLMCIKTWMTRIVFALPTP
jgi:hypothetical protein